MYTACIFYHVLCLGLMCHFWACVTKFIAFFHFFCRRLQAIGNYLPTRITCSISCIRRWTRYIHCCTFRISNRVLGEGTAWRVGQGTAVNPTTQRFQFHQVFTVLQCWTQTVYDYPCSIARIPIWTIFGFKNTQVATKACYLLASCITTPMAKGGHFVQHAVV